MPDAIDPRDLFNLEKVYVPAAAENCPVQEFYGMFRTEEYIFYFIRGEQEDVEFTQLFRKSLRRGAIEDVAAQGVEWLNGNIVAIESGLTSVTMTHYNMSGAGEAIGVDAVEFQYVDHSLLRFYKRTDSHGLEYFTAKLTRDIL